MIKSPSCEYCGRCLSVCPSYKHHLVETLGPRARIDLARAVESGELVPGPRYELSIKSCLQCLACTEICGKGVDAAQIILDARLRQGEGKLTKSRRLERYFTTKLLLDRALLKKNLRFFSLMQKVLPHDTARNLRHLPDVLSGAVGKRSLPDLARKTIDEALPETIPPAAGVQACGDVAIFTGCYGGLIRTEATLRLVEGLTGRGYTVHIPKGQSCCGAPAQLSGFGDSFRAAQKHNLDVYAALPGMPILTQCATCHRTLTREYENTEFSGRIADAALFLQEHDRKQDAHNAVNGRAPEHIQLLRPGRPVSQDDPLLVTVHDPCHLRLDRNVTRAIRERLAARPWIRLVEMAEAGICCGGGGVSSLKNPDLADELGSARAAMVTESGADLVTAQCPGCVLQLGNHLRRSKAAQRAVHVLELVGD